MEEVFAEQIIKSRMTGKELIIRALAIFLVLLSILSFAFIGFLAITLTILVVYLAWNMFSYTSIEYEYAVVNSELTIDKIMGQRKRKRVASFDFKNAEIIANVATGMLDNYKGSVKVQDYTSHNSGNDVVGVVFNNNNAEKTELLFEPNEKIIDAIKRIRPGICKL